MRVAIARLVFAALAIATSAAAHAQLRDCQPPQDGSYLVFLDELRFTPRAFPNRTAMLRMFNRLHEHLDEGRDAEMAGLEEEANFRVARCENRLPAIDGADYTPAVVRNLYGRKVVVEIWGEVDQTLDAEKRRHPSAQINFLLVPLRHGVVEGSERVAAVQRFHYPDRQIVATDFVDLVSNVDLHAFVAAAIGVRAFDNADFKLAHRMLCRGAAQLARTADRLAAEPATKAHGEQVRELHAFLTTLAAGSITAGRERTPPLPFALLQEPQNPCPGS